VALALYRKYRPRTFAEIIGQEHVTEPLSQALRSGRLHHAYLFSGPRGCGKTSSARILARSLNCANGPTPDPCGECQSCRDLAPDGIGSMDVIEIDAASHGGVDDARELRERAFFAPVSSRFKVYVIDEAHMVSSAGFNALLKLVEEPPDFVKFVFATTEPEKVLGTIKSRTHHYPFRLIPPGVLRPYLEKLCEREGVKVESAIFPLVVRAGAGSARDSLSVLDQLIAGAGPDGVSYARAVALLGVTDVALIDEMCDALDAGDGAAAYATVDRVAEAGHDPRRFASDLLERLRDLIVLQQVPDAAAKGLLDAPDDQLERMAAQAARLGPATLSRFADIVHNGLTEMRGTTAPRLLLELITARMLLPGADDSSSALLQRLERMERRLGAAGEQAPVLPPTVPAQPAAPAVAPPPHVVTPPSPAPVSPSVAPSAPTVAPPPGAPPPATASVAGRPSAAPADPVPADRASAESGAPAQRASTGAPAESNPPGVLDAAAVRRVWDDEILSMVRRKKPRIAALMREATVREVQGNTLVLLFRHSVHAEMLSRSPEVLTEAITEVFGGTWQLRCEVGGGPAGAPRGAGRPPGASGAAQPSSQGSAVSPGHATASPRSPRPAPGPPASDAADEGDDGWPTPAQLGGTSTPPTGGAAPPAAAAEDWPTPARPGGQAAASGLPSAPGGTATPDGTASDGTSASDGTTASDGTSAPAAATPTAPALAAATPAVSTPAASAQSVAAAPLSGARSAAAAAARAAAAGTSGRQTTAGRPTGSAPAAAAAPGTPTNPGASPARNGGELRDATSADEPPYDPDYDPPVRDPQYPGFDPGDEPTDDVIDERVVRESTEELALRLLAEALGAEKIDDRRA
jgi:DNA polymerase-3 subunit gamma/tau